MIPAGALSFYLSDVGLGVSLRISKSNGMMLSLVGHCGSSWAYSCMSTAFGMQ